MGTRSVGWGGEIWWSYGRNQSWLVLQASRKAGTRGKAATKQAQRGSSNVFSMFEQAQIQEFKEVSAPCQQSPPFWGPLFSVLRVPNPG